MIHTLCTIRFRNQRTDQGSLDPGSVHFSCMSFAVSCIRRVRSRRGPARPGRRVSPPSWMSSRLDGPPHRGQCPLEVQRACGLFAEDYHRRQGRCAPLVWSTAVPCSDELCPHKAPEGALGDLVQPDLSANPLRGDSVAVRWPPYRRGPLGRSRREATPICRLRSPWKMAVPGPGLIVSASVADDFPCRPGGRVTGSRCREFRPKGTPI